MVLKTIWAVVGAASIATVMGVVGYIEQPDHKCTAVHLLILVIGLVGGIAALHGLDKEI
jgi:hypothetical protein